MNKTNKSNETLIGAESIPPPSKIEGLQAIVKLKPLAECRFNVFTYALNQDIVDKDGNIDDFRGMFFIVGSFATKNKAEKHLEDLILKTKHHEFYIAEYGKPIRIETKIDSSNISRIYVDNNNEIKKLETEQYKRDKEAYEKRIKIEKDIVKETENEYDKNHIDHFQRQCTLAIKNKIAYETHKLNMEKSLSNYDKNLVELREHYKNHPEHEEQWLPNLKEKLQERNELCMYNMIESNYEKFRDEFLEGINLK